MLAGKYLNGYGKDDEYATYIPPGRDEWHAVIKRHYFHYVVKENGTLLCYGDDAGDYETDVPASKVMNFISRTAGRQPFFIYFSPFAYTAQRLHARVTKARFPARETKSSNWSRAAKSKTIQPHHGGR